MPVLSFLYFSIYDFSSLADMTFTDISDACVRDDVFSYVFLIAYTVREFFFVAKLITIHIEYINSSKSWETLFMSISGKRSLPLVTFGRIYSSVQRWLLLLGHKSKTQKQTQSWPVNPFYSESMEYQEWSLCCRILFHLNAAVIPGSIYQSRALAIGPDMSNPI